MLRRTLRLRRRSGLPCRCSNASRSLSRSDGLLVQLELYSSIANCLVVAGWVSLQMTGQSCRTGVLEHSIWISFHVGHWPYRVR